MKARSDLVIVRERAEKKMCYRRRDAVAPLRSKCTVRTSEVHPEVHPEVHLTELGAIVALLGSSKS